MEDVIIGPGDQFQLTAGSKISVAARLNIIIPSQTAIPARRLGLPALCR